MRELHLFAGIGGGILAGQLLGHRCVGAVELDPYCRAVLAARQADGSIEPFPIHDDVWTFAGSPWRGHVDIVCGGSPCQDISNAGKRAGIGGKRSGLWHEMVRIVRDVGPSFVFVENVAALLVRGIDVVLGSLADLGFDAEWTVLSAADVGAAHLRRRLWVLAAHPDRRRQQERLQLDGEPHLDAADGSACRRHADGLGAEAVADAGRSLLEEWRRTQAERTRAATRGERWWPTQRPLCGGTHGVPSGLDRVARLRGLGNAQVPLQAAAAFRILMERLNA